MQNICIINEQILIFNSSKLSNQFMGLHYYNLVLLCIHLKGNRIGVGISRWLFI